MVSLSQDSLAPFEYQKGGTVNSGSVPTTSGSNMWDKFNRFLYSASEATANSLGNYMGIKTVLDAQDARNDQATQAYWKQQEAAGEASVHQPGGPNAVGSGSAKWQKPAMIAGAVVVGAIVLPKIIQAFK